MYKRKIPVDLSCPLRLTISLIDSKWKSCILDELRNRCMRPSELHKALPEATPRVLDLQLKENRLRLRVRSFGGDTEDAMTLFKKFRGCELDVKPLLRLSGLE